MANAILFLNALSTIVDTVSKLDTTSLKAGMSPPGTPDTLNAMWAHITEQRPKVGLDPLASARCHALQQANTARYAAMNAQTPAQAAALTATADAMMRVHDALAGATWYTLPWTLRDLRAESQRLNDNAETREILLKILQLATDHFAKG